MSAARRDLWILGGLAVAAGVGLVVVSRSTASVLPGAPPPPKQVTSKKRIFPGARILLVGDSLAVGLGVPMTKMASDFGASLSKGGIVGTTISDWDKSVMTQSDPPPTLVLLSIGTNDMKMSSPAGEKQHLTSLLSKLGSGGADVVIIGPPTMPFPDRGVREMLASSGASIFPSEALSIPRGPDGIHPTAKGYSGWAGAIWSWLG